MRQLALGVPVLVMLLASCMVAHVDAVHEFAMEDIKGQSQMNSVSLSMGCPEFLESFYSINASQSNQPFRSFTLTKGGGYGYVAIHFARLWVPHGGYVLLRGVEDFDTKDVVLNLTDTFPSGELYKDVFAPPVRAKEFRIEFYRNRGAPQPDASTKQGGAFSEDHCFGFVVDWYDYKLVDDNRNITATSEATCAQDNSVEAVCYFGQHRESYLASRAVARLLIEQPSGESAACTGWLIGSEGHLITNNHCVKNADEASVTTVEFMADADVCTTSCTKWGACPGTVEAISTTLVHTNAELDYTILKLQSAVDLPKKYGFLRLKASQGRVSQQVYIPQHPLFYGKRIAMVGDFNTFITILDTNASGCDSFGYSYNGDTQVGSSGSPVIDSTDHGVVALHHCGQYCSNTGIPSVEIIRDLQWNNKLPLNAIDLGDPKDPNTRNFPAFTPKEAAAPLTLTSQLKLDGAIQVAADGKTVSVDQIEFTLANDADVAIDILSMELSDDGVYKDLNGDGKAQYLDAVVFLFVKGNPKVLKKADDSDTDTGKDDGSINYRDPYLRTFLKKGTYLIAIASLPASDADAYNGQAVLSDPPELFTCSKRGGNYGSYRVEVLSSDTVSFSRLPQSVTIPGDCTLPSSAICQP